MIPSEDSFRDAVVAGDCTFVGFFSSTNLEIFPEIGLVLDCRSNEKKLLSPPGLLILNVKIYSYVRAMLHSNNPPISSEQYLAVACECFEPFRFTAVEKAKGDPMSESDRSDTLPLPLCILHTTTTLLIRPLLETSSLLTAATRLFCTP